MELGQPMAQEAGLELRLEPELAALELELEAMKGLVLPLGLVLVEEWVQIAQADALEFLDFPMMMLLLFLFPNSMVLAWVVEAQVMVSPDLNGGC